MRSHEVLGFTQSLIGKPCPKCGNLTLEVTEEKDLIEELAEIAESAGSNVEIISPETEEGQMLLKSFGGIAAILRYKME
jgi:peptide chain release factor subunit 1